MFSKPIEPSSFEHISYLLLLVAFYTAFYQTPKKVKKFCCFYSVSVLYNDEYTYSVEVAKNIGQVCRRREISSCLMNRTCLHALTCLRRFILSTFSEEKYAN